METIIRLKPSELNIVLIEKIKALLADKDDVEITLSFSESTYNTLHKTQLEQSYKEKINRSIQNVEQGKNIISFTGDEFEKMAKMLRTPLSL